MAAVRTLSLINATKTTFPRWYHRSYVHLCQKGARHLSGTRIICERKRNSPRLVRRNPIISIPPTRPNVPETPSEPTSINSLIPPLPSRSIYDEYEEDIGADIVGHLNKDGVRTVLKAFSIKPSVRTLCTENELDHELFRHTLQSFTTMCMEQKLSPDLHIKLHDIINGTGNEDQLFPFFLEHSRDVFPHLDNMNQLTKITDLTSPTDWYVDARKIARKIVIHAGPTNSGKTYHAMQHFTKADRGIYCSPLRLLAGEVSRKSCSLGTPCDLVTGEERTGANEDDTPADHLACTVEMANLSQEYDVAVIDEMQMIRDKERGWAWTQAFLGLLATEIHVCGEPAIIPLIENLAVLTGDTVQVKQYERLTSLTYLDEAVQRYANVHPGDCIVCFNKPDIFTVTSNLEKMGVKTAIIYGSLPPATKLAHADRFNDPEDPCNVLVATDAVGMGLNLNIKRIVFYNLKKTSGFRVKTAIETTLARQIAGRAGRYNSQYPEGEVTTFTSRDLRILKKIVTEEISPIETAGLSPTPDQIELFGYYLPSTSLSKLLEIFERMAKHDQKHFFLCNLNGVKTLAELLEDVQLPLKQRYIYACAPIKNQEPLIVTLFIKFATRHSKNQPIELEWLMKELGLPRNVPENLEALAEMENIFNSLDVYLWLSCRFRDIYPDHEAVCHIQKELEGWIEEGVRRCQELLRSETMEGQAMASLMEVLRRMRKVKPLQDDLEPDAVQKQVQDFMDLVTKQAFSTKKELLTLQDMVAKSAKHTEGSVGKKSGVPLSTPNIDDLVKTERLVKTSKQNVEKLVKRSSSAKSHNADDLVKTERFVKPLRQNVENVVKRESSTDRKTVKDFMKMDGSVKTQNMDNLVKTEMSGNRKRPEVKVKRSHVNFQVEKSKNNSKEKLDKQNRDSRHVEMELQSSKQELRTTRNLSFNNKQHGKGIPLGSAIDGRNASKLAQRDQRTSNFRDDKRCTNEISPISGSVDTKKKERVLNVSDDLLPMSPTEKNATHSGDMTMHVSDVVESTKQKEMTMNLSEDLPPESETDSEAKGQEEMTMNLSEGDRESKEISPKTERGVTAWFKNLFRRKK